MKQMKKMLSILLALALTFSVAVDVPVFAAEEVDVPVEYNLPFDQWKSETMPADGTHWWKITMPSNGWLTVKVQGYGLTEATMELRDADKDKEWASSSYDNASPSNPKTRTCIEPLRKGEYWLKVHSDWGASGTYKVFASLESRDVTTLDSNGELDTAQTISLNQEIKGFFSRQDEVDIFKITLPTAMKLNNMLIPKESDFDDMHYTLYNSSYEVVENTSFGRAEPHIWESKKVLAAGTYYIKINPEWGDHGAYTFKCGQKVPVSSITVRGPKKPMKPGAKTALIATVNPANAANKAVEWSSNSYAVSVDDNGNITASDYYCGVATITATSKDDGSKVGSCKVVVLPNKITSTSAYNYYSRKVYFSYSGVSGASGYQIQYATNGKFKGAKIKKTKLSGLYIKGLHKNKTYYFRVRPYVKSGSKTYYGAWSKGKKCKVKY